MMSIPIPPFTLIGATTRIGLLTAPMRGRFGINQHIEFYTPESLFEIRSQTTYKHMAPERRTFSPPSSTEWKLLATVAARPAIAAKVDPSALDPALAESQILIELARWGREFPGASDAMMLEHFRDSEHAVLLAHTQAYGADLKQSEEQALEFVRLTLWSLEIQRKDKEIQSLGDRLQKGQLSKEEHREYADDLDRQALNSSYRRKGENQIARFLQTELSRFC
jgi:hypothetical protein